jgi:hypothetical protein
MKILSILAAPLLWPFLAIRAGYRPLKRWFVAYADAYDEREYARTLPIEAGGRRAKVVGHVDVVYL